MYPQQTYLLLLLLSAQPEDSFFEKVYQHPHLHELKPCNIQGGIIEGLDHAQLRALAYFF